MTTGPLIALGAIASRCSLPRKFLTQHIGFIMASPAPAAQDQDGELRASPPRLPRLQTGADTADSAVLVSPVEATPASAIPTSGPAATTTATAIRHRRTASDIKPTSPYARRMSLSSTPQSIRGDLPRDYAVLRYARAVASRPVLSIAIVLSVFTLYVQPLVAPCYCSAFRAYTSCAHT